MDFVGFPDNAIFYGIGLELMIDNPRDYMETWAPARLTRCTITKATEAVTCEILADENFGLPAFNIEHYQKKPYNYACVRPAALRCLGARVVPLALCARAHHACLALPPCGSVGADAAFLVPFSRA
jgi:hypothetical protein